MDNRPVYEIGKFYTVPVVYAELFKAVDYWPALGPKHEDREIIGFEHDHYHLDFRFFSKRRWDWFIRRMMDTWFFYDKWCAWRNALAVPLIAQKGYPLAAPVYRRRKCQRPMPDLPFEKQAKYLPKLYDAYQGYVLKDDLICPHRGAPLVGLPTDHEGCITCPLHGLRWNLETGRLQPPRFG